MARACCLLVPVGAGGSQGGTSRCRRVGAARSIRSVSTGATGKLTDLRHLTPLRGSTAVAIGSSIRGRECARQNCKRWRGFSFGHTHPVSQSWGPRITSAHRDRISSKSQLTSNRRIALLAAPFGLNLNEHYASPIVHCHGALRGGWRPSSLRRRQPGDDSTCTCTGDLPAARCSGREIFGGRGRQAILHQRRFTVVVDGATHT
jgi:hypothetical protein